MPLLSRWDIYHWRTRVSRAAPWIVYPCAVIGFVLSLASACASGPAPTVNDDAIKTYACEALTAFLRATNADPGAAGDYFPKIDMQNVDLPAQPEQILTVTAQKPEPNGNSSWLVPVIVAADGGATQSWKIPIAATGSGRDAKYAATRLPSPWPGLATDKDRAATNTQALPKDSPIHKTVSGFVSAWMSGGADVGRYTTTATVAPPWPDRPYTSVDIKAVRIHGVPPVNVKGTITVVADVTANGRYSRECSYTLQLKAINGQWMVAAINPPT
jgi:hypothetical protein